MEKTLRITADLWVIADTHFGHKNIIAYCRRPTECDRMMVERWTAAVGPTDQLLHLGDVAVGMGNQYGQSLPGEKFLIKGNHDGGRKEWWERLGYQRVAEPLDGEVEGVRVVFSHRPLPADHLRGRINIHGHIHNNGYPRIIGDPSLYRNVSVEVTDYRPVRLGDVLAGRAGSNPERAGWWDETTGDRVEGG